MTRQRSILAFAAPRRAMPEASFDQLATTLRVLAKLAPPLRSGNAALHG